MSESCSRLCLLLHHVERKFSGIFFPKSSRFQLRLNNCRPDEMFSKPVDFFRVVMFMVSDEATASSSGDAPFCQQAFEANGWGPDLFNASWHEVKWVLTDFQMIWFTVAHQSELCFSAETSEAGLKSFQCSQSKPGQMEMTSHQISDFVSLMKLVLNPCFPVISGPAEPAAHSPRRCWTEAHHAYLHQKSLCFDLQHIALR